MLYGRQRLCGPAATSILRAAGDLLQEPSRPLAECELTKNARVWCQQSAANDPVVVIVDVEDGRLRIRAIAIGPDFYTIFPNGDCAAP